MWDFTLDFIDKIVNPLSTAGVLRSLWVWRESDPGHLCAALHDRLPDDHQGESSTYRENTTYKSVLKLHGPILIWPQVNLLTSLWRNSGNKVESFLPSVPPWRHISFPHQFSNSSLVTKKWPPQPFTTACPSAWWPSPQPWRWSPLIFTIWGSGARMWVTYNHIISYHPQYSQLNRVKYPPYMAQCKKSVWEAIILSLLT